jgi:hypothetical protein
MLSTGSLYVTSGTGATDQAIALSGATFSSCAIAGVTATVNAASTLCYDADGTAAATFTVVPNAGVTTFTISQFDSVAYATSAERVHVE